MTKREHQSVDRMEIEGNVREKNPPLRPTHPPKDKWPAIRPAIQRVTKNLSDEEEDKLTLQSMSKLASKEKPPLRANLKITEM